MTRILFAASLAALVITGAQGQVRPQYLYAPATPYGVLDIRTRISASDYYYLREGATFSHRRNADGSATDSYADMTSWDSSPYRQGHLRRTNGAADYFIMNYRLLPPVGYNPNYPGGYPMLVLFHGAVERGNCYYGDCHHADWTYDPNVNQPPAPAAANHPLLNNDHHLDMLGREHLAAVAAAAGVAPDQEAPAGAFPGFVLVAQMLNVWDSLNVQDVIRLVQLHCETYNIDQDRIYTEGLSIGGYAVYEALKRAPWLFAGAVPMSAVSEAANIFLHNQQDKVAHVPIWVFQGGSDKNPSPAMTEATLKKFRDAGATPRYTKYEGMGHRVWENAFKDPELLRWLLRQRKSNLHALHDRKSLNGGTTRPTLVLAEGFLAYQWEKDGAVMAGQNAHRLTVTEPGTYRARFSRRSASPAESDWNEWSPPVTITASGSGGGNGEGGEGGGSDTTNVVTSAPDDSFYGLAVYPNPSEGTVFVDIPYAPAPVRIEVSDAMGKIVYEGVLPAGAGVSGLNLSGRKGVHIVKVFSGDAAVYKRLLMR